MLTKQDLFIMTIKKKNKGIFGTTTNDELKELKEEGVNVEVIPWIEDKSN